MPYAAMTEDAAQRSIRTFYECVKLLNGTQRAVAGHCKNCRLQPCAALPERLCKLFWTLLIWVQFKKACEDTWCGAIYESTIRVCVNTGTGRKTIMIDMFTSIVKKIKGFESTATQTDEALELQIATCALLLEMAHADDECSSVEQEHIAALMQQRFGLSAEAFADVSALSERRRRDEIDLWGFTSTIKKHFSAEQKMQVMEMLWSVIYADDVLADYEDHLVHTLAKLLGMDHRDMIAAKVKVLDASKQGG